MAPGVCCLWTWKNEIKYCILQVELQEKAHYKKSHARSSLYASIYNRLCWCCTVMQAESAFGCWYLAAGSSNKIVFILVLVLYTTFDDWFRLPEWVNSSMLLMPTLLNILLEEYPKVTVWNLLIIKENADIVRWWWLFVLFIFDTLFIHCVK